MLAERYKSSSLRPTAHRLVCCPAGRPRPAMASRSPQQQLVKAAGPQVVTVSATSGGSGAAAAAAPGPVLLQVRWVGGCSRT